MVTIWYFDKHVSLNLKVFLFLQTGLFNFVELIKMLERSGRMLQRSGIGKDGGCYTWPRAIDRQCNMPFPSHLVPMFQKEPLYKAFRVSDLYEKEPVGTHFHMNGLPRRLVLRQRQKTTRSERRKISHSVVSPKPFSSIQVRVNTGSLSYKISHGRFPKISSG